MHITTSHMIIRVFFFCFCKSHFDLFGYLIRSEDSCCQWLHGHQRTQVFIILHIIFCPLFISFSSPSLRCLPELWVCLSWLLNVCSCVWVDESIVGPALCFCGVFLHCSFLWLHSFSRLLFSLSEGRLPCLVATFSCNTPDLRRNLFFPPLFSLHVHIHYFCLLLDIAQLFFSALVFSLIPLFLL